MTDFENAAFAVFVVLLSRAIFTFNLNFYIPISKVCPKVNFYFRKNLLTTPRQVDENMARAQQRNASASKKFFFKKDVYSTGRSATSSAASSSGASTPPEGSVPRKKDKKMKNCFPPPPLPENGFTYRGPVEDEYEEMTMKEIMNGKARFG